MAWFGRWGGIVGESRIDMARLLVPFVAVVVVLVVVVVKPKRIGLLPENGENRRYYPKQKKRMRKRWKWKRPHCVRSRLREHGGDDDVDVDFDGASKAQMPLQMMQTTLTSRHQ